jgi:hypothetical protein
MRPYYLVVFAVLPMMAQTQLLTFGVKGGVPTQTPLGQTDSRTPFVLGPTVNVRILSRLSIETGVLFHRMGQQLNTRVFLFPENAVTVVSSTERGRALELPFLAKYHFRTEYHTWRPFVTVGPTVRRTSLDGRYFPSVLSGTSLGVSTAQPSLNTKTVKWSVDPAVGAGIDFKTGHFHLEPEVRYSYWGAGKNSDVRKNQVEFLLGFRF